jgi:hypothetical protein
MPERNASTAARPAAARLVAAWIASATIAGLVGCASTPTGPSYLEVARPNYDRAFDEACKVARDFGLVPEIVDRESGTIETQPRLAGSAVEPWAWKAQSGGDIVEGTLAFERRRARFEFVPAGFRAATPESAAPLAGPVTPGSERREAFDRARGAGDLELRVSVSVERQFRPGAQGSAWTRAGGSYWRDASLDIDRNTPRDLSTWTPVARDEKFERLLLAEVEKALAAQAVEAGAAGEASTDPTPISN